MLFQKKKSSDGAGSSVKLKKKTMVCSTEAAAISIGIHVLLILFAGSIVAIKYIQKRDAAFEGENVSRPKLERRQLKMPTKVRNLQKKSSRPKVTSRMAVPTKQSFSLPDMSNLDLGFDRSGGRSVGGIGTAGSFGFNIANVDFFGARSGGEKVVFVVHFGPATIGDNPYERMTGYTIRQRLAEMVRGMPQYTLFNVACFYLNATWAMSPQMMLANSDNKQKVLDWMEPVNPLEGEYDHCFSKPPRSVAQAKKQYPTRVENLPFYAPKWVYPYAVPEELEKKYLPDAGGDKSRTPEGFVHWSRGVAWAVLTQKPDAIFVLTTNYIDAWGKNNNGEPRKLLAAYEEMFLDVYGDNKQTWPKISVAVLARANWSAGNDPDVILNSQFGPIWKETGGRGSVIMDITEYMTDEEERLYEKYKEQYGK